MIHNSTSTSPARLVRNACSSLPECFRTWLSTETSIPTAAILNIIVIDIHGSNLSFLFSKKTAL